VDEGVVIGAGGISVKAPKTKVSVRKLSVDAETLGLLARLRDEQLDLATRAECELGEDAFLFSFVPGGTTPPYPDVFTKN
ncbi:MAG: hypothetical protein ACP5HZ_13150, partial [Ferrimicrobium sp.]